MRIVLIFLTLQLLSIPMVTSGGEIYGRVMVGIKPQAGMSKESKNKPPGPEIEKRPVKDSTKVKVSRRKWETKVRGSQPISSEVDSTYTNTLGEYRLFLKGQGRCTFEVLYKKGNVSATEKTRPLIDSTSCFSPEGSEKYDWVIVDTAEDKTYTPLLKKE